MSAVIDAPPASGAQSGASASTVAGTDGWSAQRANRIRWVWLGTTITLAAALVVGSYVNYRGVADAAATVNRGQAEVLQFAQQQTFRRDQPFTVARLDSFVQAHQASGLRYFGVIDSSGDIVVSGGVPTSPPNAEGPLTLAYVTSHKLVEVEGRLRAYYPRPPLRRGVFGADSAAAWFSGGRGGGGGGGGPRGGGPFFEMMEFVPVAPALVSRAQRSLILAWIGAGLLTLATLLFWRTSTQYDSVRQRLEEQRRLALLGEMSAVLAHEIRNPLASLKGHAQLLAEKLPEGTPEKRKADRVVDEAKRLEVLTNDLLDFARSGPIDFRRVDPGALLRACAVDLPSAAITVDTTNAPDSWYLDERRFSYAVLANLLRNAVQASPAERPAEARVFVENGALTFTVRDHGDGLPAGQETRIFDPFFTTRTTGTGLGLALARRIVELHGGSISARNADGGGAIFRVELPPRTA
jgi:two-component system sensor histidine kinase HydH